MDIRHNLAQNTALAGKSGGQRVPPYVIVAFITLADFPYAADSIFTHLNLEEVSLVCIKERHLSEFLVSPNFAALYSWVYWVNVRASYFVLPAENTKIQVLVEGVGIDGMSAAHKSSISLSALASGDHAWILSQGYAPDVTVVFSIVSYSVVHTIKFKTTSVVRKYFNKCQKFKF